jgi:hypothetical protein
MMRAGRDRGRSVPSNGGRVSQWIRHDSGSMDSSTLLIRFKAIAPGGGGRTAKRYRVEESGVIGGNQ